MWLAQISDLHLTSAGSRTGYGEDTGPSLARCVASLCACDPPPAAVVASGDLTDQGSSEEYARLKDLLAPLAMPVFVMPGNHDRRDALREAFAHHAYLPAVGPLHYHVDVGPLLLILLDTVIPGEDAGTLEDVQLAWLDEVLAADPRKPTIIFMHHPPLRTGMHYMDDLALDARSTERLSSIVERHAQIQRIACGHVHRAAHGMWCGKLVSVCPSTAFQAKLDFSRPGDFVPSREGPAYAAHYWNDGVLVTHTIAVSSAV